jgi:hypothetical protein
MTSRVTPRARQRGDRAGDPLDGLVNLFDLGIVLAVAFLLAALQSENVTVVRNDSSGQTLIVKQGDKLKTVRLSRKTVTGAGERVGDVFRLADGRLVYVERAPASAATPPTTTAPAPTTTTP